MLPLKLENPKVDIGLLASEANLIGAESRLMILAQDTGVSNRHHPHGDWVPDFEAKRESLRRELERYWNCYKKLEFTAAGNGTTMARYVIDEYFKRLREQLISWFGVETYMADFR